MARMTAVMTSEMTIDPKQPNLFEKKKNIRYSLMGTNQPSRNS
jgi:hypothetical protein